MNNFNSSKINSAEKRINKKLSKDTAIMEEGIHNIPKKGRSSIMNNLINEVAYDGSYNDIRILNEPKNITRNVDIENVTSAASVANVTNGIHIENTGRSKNYDHFFLNNLSDNNFVYIPDRNIRDHNQRNSLSTFNTVNTINTINPNNTINPCILDETVNDYNAHTTIHNGSSCPLRNRRGYTENVYNYNHADIEALSNNHENVNRAPFYYTSGNNRQLYSAENTLSPLYSRCSNIEEGNYPYQFPYDLYPPSKSDTYLRTTTPYFPSDNNDMNSLCSSPSFSGYSNEYPFINNDNFRTIPPHLYCMMKDARDDSFLKKGIHCALNACNFNKKESFNPKYEYILNGPNFKYISNHQNGKKFDIFKRITLTVGTYLDDIVNIMIAMLESSYKSIRRHNDTNMYDLHPFYNPDPHYSRGERPTLKTGSNLFDKINSALDSTTLEKHRNLPRNFGRIPIPKTQKTGSKVIDGINKMLDNLFIEPLSYRNYNYYSEKCNSINQGKQKVIL
ncbi:inner membrane complex suture component, putative [Plasmodium malariae]|uniref:Inner membrane complex suture component, putative n=1 Tax=Plasmodium malariae TaxID=5858 RepID=A0A1C3L0F6_PLAMA|nr:inner membrane complex suture component, putative [Plasmodium malariae]